MNKKWKRVFYGILVTILLLITVFETREVRASKKKVEKQKVTLSMVGDVLLHLTVENTSKEKDGTYNFKPIFKEIKELISGYDISIVNQETLPGGEELKITGYPMFNAPIEIAEAIHDTGFDVVLHANNHALDRGKKGIVNTLNLWREKYPNIDVIGMYQTKKDSSKITIKKVNGIKIAILNYTYGTNGLKPPYDMPFAVNYLQKQKVEADIKKARKMADFIIVCPHWGTEYYHGVSEYQKYWASIFLKNKVDLVLGTHPHVIEPIAWLKDKKSGHKMLVYYSLGNFVNGTLATGAMGDRYIGGLAEVEITKQKGKKAKISKYGVRALLNHRENKRFGSRVYELSKYDETLFAKHAIRQNHSTFHMKYCTDLLDKVWGKLWK